MLALLVPDITNPHHFALIRGAEIQAAAAGYTLVLGDGQESPALGVGHADRLGSFVDGFVLISPRMDDSALRELRARHPVVLFNRTMPGVASVVVDAVDAARQIVEHLHALGHRRLAYLGGPRTSWIDARRWQALEDQAGRRGIAALRLGPFEPVLEAGAAAADAGLASGVGALVAFNDLLAIGVLQRLERRGVAVPGRISVVGADDIFGAAFCHPPLTTVASPAERAGRLLVDMLTGVADAAELVLPCPLVARESTGPAPG
jgi:DNA-binding LacI/PurR family transcriptional regulator